MGYPFVTGTGLDYLYLLQAAFTIWMLVDAYRRQADTVWFWVIFLVPFVGAWAYFFAVKLGDFTSLGGWFGGPRRLSLDELRYRAEQAPTLASQLELAECLMDRRQHGEAVPLLESALKREPEHCQVLYALAFCHTELGHPEKALPLLDQVMLRDRCWSDYRAWRLQIAARGQAGDGTGALEVSRELVRLAPTLEHRCLLAERLLAEGQPEEASAVLEESLEAHRYAPGPIRRRNRRWVSRARALRKRVHSQSGR